MDNLLSQCPVCSKQTTNLGALRAKNGVIRLQDAGCLYQCSVCGLLFRRPYPSISYLNQAYSELSSDLWIYSDRRPDFILSLNVILNSLKSGRILDIGCYRGDFLDMLPGNYQKYGVEASKSAREVAKQRGITLVGSFIEDIEIDRPMFHVITLLDVIEHLPYPLTSLQRIARLLLPGGIIILSTGNTNVLPWRLMRLNYWYYFPEHVSFFNPRWFHWVAKQLDLDTVLVKKFSHYKGSVFKRLYQFTKCIAFLIVENLKRYPLLHQVICSFYPLSKVCKWSSPPTINLWRDHMLVVMRSTS